jgi:hypothetical protein
MDCRNGEGDQSRKSDVAWTTLFNEEARPLQEANIP